MPASPSEWPRLAVLKLKPLAIRYAPSLSAKLSRLLRHFVSAPVREKIMASEPAFVRSSIPYDIFSREFADFFRPLIVENCSPTTRRRRWAAPSITHNINEHHYRRVPRLPGAVGEGGVSPGGRHRP